MFVVGWNKDLILFDIEKGKIRSTQPHSYEIIACYSSSSGIFSGSRDRKVIKTDLVDSDPPKQLQILRGHFAPVSSMDVFDSEKRLVSGSHDKKCRIWSLENGKCIAQLREGHNDRVNCVKYISSSKNVLSSSTDHTTCIWDLEKQDVVKKIYLGENPKPGDPEYSDPDEHHSYAIYSTDIHQELGIIFSGGGSGRVRSYLVKEDFGKVSEADLKETVHAICVFQGRNEVAIGSGGDIQLFDVRRGFSVEPIRKWKAHDNDITSISRIEGGFVTVARGKMICVWNFEGEKIRTFEQSEYCSCAQVSGII